MKCLYSLRVTIGELFMSSTVKIPSEYSLQLFLKKVSLRRTHVARLTNYHCLLKMSSLAERSPPRGPPKDYVNQNDE